MTHRPTFLFLMLVPLVAAAQVDEWSTFPSDPPKAGQPQKEAPAKPAAKPAAADKDDGKGKEAQKEAKGQASPKAAPAPAPAAKTASGQPPGPTAAPAASAPATGAPAPGAPAGSPAPDGAAPGTPEMVTNLAAGADAAPEPPPEAVVVSQNERFLPGTEPHSPSTWGRTWNAKENRRVTPGAVGSTGLHRVSAATLGPKGVLRFGVVGEYFNQQDFPVLGARNIRSAGTFSVSFVPLPWLETFLAYAASANTNSFSSPTLIQALGDVTLGAKASREWARGFSAGLELRLHSFSGVGNQDVSRYAWGFSPRAVVSYDLREPLPKVPLLVHANIGATFDGTGDLVRSHPLNTAEEFALNVNRYNRFTTGVAVEAPLAVVAPFIEYNLGVPLGVEGGQLVAPNGEVVPLSRAMPQTLGVGLKVTAIKDLTLTTGANFGLSRTVGRGVPATPPWNVYFGAAFNIDPFQRGETKVVETIRERKIEEKVVEAPKTSRVEGVVVDAQTKKPLPGVIVAMVGAGLPPVASDAAAGRFLTHDVKLASVTLKVDKDGYKEARKEVALQPGETVKVELALEPEAKLAHFLVSVTGGTRRRKAPIDAEVRFIGPVEDAVKTVAGKDDPAKLDAPPGKYLVNVLAEGYLSQTREVQISEDAEMKLAFELDKEPKKKLVIVKEDKIEILQQVHFRSGKSTIMRDSYSLLDQVVDAIVKNGIKRFRIEGHTDNRGSDKRNLKLSQDRADAVAAYLIKQGIDPGRIEAVGYGEAKPVAPNLTARGRELNRRVEFLITER